MRKYTYTSNRERESEKMPRDPQETCIRRPLHITVSPEVHDCLKNRVGNINRFIDMVVRDAILSIQSSIIALSQNQMDRGGN
ncbi:MAG: hypothetical protein WC096_08075 [Sphaerochaetaceae bacterium]